jgi:hypothetical protein
MTPKVLSGRESHARVSNDGAFKQAGEIKKSGPAAAPSMIRHAGGTSSVGFKTPPNRVMKNSKALFK